MGDKPVTIGLKVDDKITFNVSKTKVKVDADENVKITWSLEDGTSWWMQPQGIEFYPGWPGPAPVFHDNKYTVSYVNLPAFAGTFRYFIRVQSMSITPNTLVLDPEVENGPPPHPNKPKKR
jgi:hypothetical protein